MYEELNTAQKSLELYDEALDLWKYEPNRAGKNMFGGFTADEIIAISDEELELIMKLCAAKGRIGNSSASLSKTHQLRFTRSWLDAIDIYEQYTKNKELLNRSIIFPIFSGLFVLVKFGKIEQDKERTFELQLITKFIREAKAFDDPVHYTRALAMECEYFCKVGKYKKALTSFDELAKQYVPEEHSDAIAQAYGNDRTSQAFAHRALCLMELGRESECIAACEHVINVLLPVLDHSNVLGISSLLFPVVRILKWRGEAKRMKILFQEHVLDNIEDGEKSPVHPLSKPMMFLLSSCGGTMSTKEKEEAVQWILQGDEVSDKNGKQKGPIVPDSIESLCTQLCWSVNSMLSELCLRLSMDVWNVDEKHTLIRRGLAYAAKADQKMKNEDGEVIYSIPYSVHEPVMGGLRKLAELHGLEYDDDISIGNSSGKSRYEAPIFGDVVLSSEHSGTENVSTQILKISDPNSEERSRRRYTTNSVHFSKNISDISLGSQDDYENDAEQARVKSRLRLSKSLPSSIFSERDKLSLSSINDGP
uniref:Uncharacterized protein n=1 Tax=Ditylum brightwellii TaxID=49249 RepID=A0A7S2EK19_9STRA